MGGAVATPLQLAAPRLPYAHTRNDNPTLMPRPPLAGASAYVITATKLQRQAGLHQAAACHICPGSLFCLRCPTVQPIMHYVTAPVTRPSPALCCCFSLTQKRAFTCPAMWSVVCTATLWTQPSGPMTAIRPNRGSRCEFSFIQFPVCLFPKP